MPSRDDWHVTVPLIVMASNVFPYLPASQSSQARFMPDASLYFPASQVSHARLTPADALYLPAMQLMQAEAEAPVESDK